MSEPSPTNHPRPVPYARRLGEWAARHARAVVTTALLLTAALAIPLLAMAPTQFASTEPEGPAFDARDTIDQRFGGDVERWFFIAEAAEGDVLERDALLAVHERAEALREDPELGPILTTRTDPITGAETLGIASFADTVDVALRRDGHGGLDQASEAAVRATVDELIDSHGAETANLSQLAGRDEDTGTWRAPAMTLSVLAEPAERDGDSAGAGFGSDIAVEELGREILAVLDATGELDVHGIALDQNLTAEEQGQAAGPYIGFTVLAIVLLAGAAFRSYWILAIVGGALAALLVWLQGLANLVGLAEDQILATVVPIAMIAFGVDYAFHSLGRYREERAAHREPRTAFGRGLGAVTPALLLTLGTGALAFLATTAGPIESITQFGIAAAMALTSAFLVLGVVVPAALALTEERVTTTTRRFGRTLAVLGGLAAAGTVMATVLLLVFLSPPAGLALLAGYLLAFVLVPAWLAGRRARGAAEPARASRPGSTGAPFTLLARGVVAVAARRAVAVAARRAIVLPLAGLLTAGSAVFAVQVPVSFDVEDFFAEDTGFVTGLDKLDEHVGDQGGEPAVVLVTADFDDPAALAAVHGFTERLAAVDTELLAHDRDGRVAVDRQALDELSGASLLSPAERSQVIAEPGESDRTAIQLSVGLVGSRAQENVAAARELLDPLVADLDAELSELDGGASAVLTGDPIVRQAGLDAVTRSLQVSLPIAVVLCLVCVWVALRSARYALVTVTPIVLVVIWLYGFMSLAGFDVNLVTATIGAISIGIGIDFATHMTMRYREELRSAPDRSSALHAATRGTGAALTGSAATSAAGFVILSFAPMPMFAGFGLLTAVMIVLALASCLLVLPGLLWYVSRDPYTARTPRAAVAAGQPA
ncbi:Predicted exporter protein, RND superfamily [Haloechinothrix alba]|uniref:Predicted exporter protein, RND superfamily n=1 Tax=Haloechinothrix alba TaxID=664784 RepID=A0A238XF21_9PSEU|nr:MMPL family transporter [Haloechinothrix alba]SNR56924.1 Predicted exporter protein, RND superfamily [Haloechinothrix alba]